MRGDEEVVVADRSACTLQRRANVRIVLVGRLVEWQYSRGIRTAWLRPLRNNEACRSVMGAFGC